MSAAVDELWADMPGDLLVVTRDDLEQLATQSAANALRDTARALDVRLRDEFLGVGGKADEWSGPRRRIWAEGVATALGCVRRHGGALAHGRETL